MSLPPLETSDPSPLGDTACLRFLTALRICQTCSAPVLFEFVKSATDGDAELAASSNLSEFVHRGVSAAVQSQLVASVGILPSTTPTSLQLELDARIWEKLEMGMRRMPSHGRVPPVVVVVNDVQYASDDVMAALEEVMVLGTLQGSGHPRNMYKGPMSMYWGAGGVGGSGGVAGDGWSGGDPPDPKPFGFPGSSCALSPFPQPTLFVCVAVREGDESSVIPSLLDRFLLRVSMPFEPPKWPVESTGPMPPSTKQHAAGHFFPADPREESVAPELCVAVDCYIHDVLVAIRGNPAVAIGPTPRSTSAVLDAARALALEQGRQYVTYNDVRSVFVACVGHRVTPVSIGAQVVEDALRAVQLPTTIWSVDGETRT